MMKKSHIYSFSKHTGSKGCTKSQECYKIKASRLIKTLKTIEEVLFNHNHTKKIKLYLKKFILLYNCPKMDLFFNSDLVENITKSGKKITVQGNVSTLAVTHKAKVPVYKQDVWFSKDAITNIIALKNMIKQYQVTYDSIYQIFVVNREDQKIKHWIKYVLI